MRERIGASVDPACQHPVEPVDERDLVGPGDRQGAEAGRDLRIAASEHDDPATGGEQSRRGVDDQVEALLWVEPPDEADDHPRIVRVEAEPGEQVGPAGRLARFDRARE